jgi:tRNA nucleotidyltransferase/poly(A) polymerase
MKTLNTKIELPQDVYDFQKLFSNKGYDLFVVGGAVRDHLLGKIPHDFDLVTNATPNIVIDILKGYNTDIQGAHFGVVRVFTESEPEGHEIASYRIDKSKGRDNKSDTVKVETGSHITIEDDARRRDISINALFYNIESEQIIDVVGGMDDIKNNIIRAVGVPQRRFEEDRLRILRTIRFAAVTGGRIDKLTSNAILSDNRLFGISDEDDVSRERIFLEFIKIKDKARDNNDPMIVKTFIDLLIDYGIMHQIFPVLIAEKDITPTTYLTIALAQSLKSNVVDKAFKDTLVEAKIPGKFVEIISILINILNRGVDVDNVYNLYREMKSKDVRHDILEEWIRVMGIYNKNVRGLLKYKPTTKGGDVMKDGFTKADIGFEINRRESELFKKLVD